MAATNATIDLFSALRSETKHVDDFAAMSDEELRAYVYGKDKAEQ